MDDSNINNNNLDNKERAYATGRRKNSIARVWIKRGNGDIHINGKSIDKYFTRPVLQMIVNQPLNVIQADNGFEIFQAHASKGFLILLNVFHGFTVFTDLSKDAQF